MLAISRSTIYRGMEQGTFPQPIHLGGSTVCWREREIHAWLESKAGRKLDFTPIKVDPVAGKATSDPGPVSGDELVTRLAAMLLRAVTLETIQKRRGSGRPPTSAPLVAPTTMDSLVTENRMLRQLLVDTLVELESVREQMRGRRSHPRNG
jgi:prophage regulatory protein